jgi:hypothetical protein
MKIERKQFSGVMNLDDPNEVISQQNHREANNIIFKGSGGNMRLESIPGNTSVSNPELQAGTNVCIGSYYDELKQRLFYFVYNSNGFDAIFVYAKNTGLVSTLLMSKVDSLSTEPLFNFSPNFPIASVNILYRTEEDGDIIHWTDRTNRPMKLNIKEATAVNKTYNGNWKKSYLTVGRLMPLISPICKYENDSTTFINNLRSKLYQFKYRWVYRDFTKSAWSPWSRLFAPVNVDTLATEIDPTKNNRISIVYQSGDADVVKIEIASRQSIDTTFSDPFLVRVVDKATESVIDNNPIEYKFYNNEVYSYIDVAESNQLFDYVPLKANTQELLNGNVVIYGGITEGRTPISLLGQPISLNVAKTLSLVANTVSTTQFTATTLSTYTFVYTPSYNVSGGFFNYYFSGTPVNGDVYKFIAILRHPTLPQVNVELTVNVGPSDTTLSLLEDKIYNLISADGRFATYGLMSLVTKFNGSGGQFGIRVGGNSSLATWVIAGSLTVTSYAGSAIPPDPTGVNTASYKHKSRYSFGICYFDEYGVTNGVMTTENLKVLTPEIEATTLATSQLTIPVIQFDVSSEAPAWAKFFSFVRTRNLTVSEFKTIVTLTTAVDTVNKFAYLDITDFQNNTSSYPTYNFAVGDRVRIVGQSGSADLLTDTVSNDYPILDLVLSKDVKTMTTPSTVPVDKIWLKIQYDAASMASFNFGSTNNYYIEVYTPAINASADNQLFYEFGETYPTYVVGNANCHTSSIQNQTASVPAIFKFFRGDIYNRLREATYILDKSMSDKYGSKVDGNGRPFIQDPYAKQTYFPTLVRYSLEYQAGTSVNQTNRFYASNFDEYDSEKGDIQRLKTRGRQLRVFQNRACGVVPILQSVVQTANGSDVLSQNSEIINKIQYYLGEYGLGNQFCSLASSAQSDYFSDPVRGCQVRLSGDGITSISEIYKAHYYLNPLLVKYNKTRNNITNQGEAKILGFYDQFNEEFITCMQESTGTAPDKTAAITLGFNEQRNAYTSFYSYSPEWIYTAENLVVSWKNGVLYTHDNTTNYANFYGTQYKPSITAIFNQYEQIKKRYNTITLLANKVWAAATNGDISTNLGQSSSLQATDFLFKDDKIHASFKRDASSTGGIYNGNVLKGNWASIKLQPVNGNEFVNLFYIELNILEPFNNR